MAKSFKGNYRLRSLFGKWWVIKNPVSGDESLAGPYQYFKAQAHCTGLKRAGWHDADAS